VPRSSNLDRLFKFGFAGAKVELVHFSIRALSDEFALCSRAGGEFPGRIFARLRPDREVNQLFLGNSLGMIKSAIKGQTRPQHHLAIACPAWRKKNRRLKLLAYD